MEYNGFTDEEFEKRLKKMLEAGGGDIPKLAAQNAFNFAYSVREYDTWADYRPALKDHLEMLLAKMYISILGVAKVYGLDAENISRHMDKQLGG